MFSEKISTRLKVRPEFEAALALTREIRQAAPEQQVLLTVHEMKRLARNAAELMRLSAALQADGIGLEMLAGPLTGIYDPRGMGSMLHWSGRQVIKTLGEVRTWLHGGHLKAAGQQDLRF